MLELIVSRCRCISLSQRLKEPGDERGDTYPWLVGKVVCLDSRMIV